MMLPPVQSTLEGSGAIAAIVGDRIFQTQAPQDKARPYVVWWIPSSIPGNNLSCLPEYDDQRVQIDCYSKSQIEARALAEAVRDAVEAKTNIVFGPWTEFESETLLYRWSMDAEYLNSR